MVLALATDGTRVCAMDKNAVQVDAFARYVKDAGLGEAILPLQGDVGEPSSCRSIAEQVASRFGSVDILVNNAGLGMAYVRSDHLLKPVHFLEVTPEALDAYFRVNMHGAFHMAQAVLPSMRNRGWGRIVNITTSLDTMLLEGFFPYGPTKAALEASTAIWSRDLNGTGITANVLTPGGLANTPMITDETPFPRETMIQPEVMGPPIRWLASPESDGVSGRRFVARLWDGTLLPAEAAGHAGSPVAWTSGAAPTQWPGEAGFGGNTGA